MTPGPGPRVARNLVVTASGEVVGAGLHLLVAIVIARYLDVQRYGQYSYVLAFVGVFQLLVSVGLGRILVREIAVNRDEAARYMGAVKSLMWLLSIGALGLIVGASRLVAMAEELRLPVLIAGAAVIATIHATGYGAVFRAFERMEVNAAGFVAHKGVFLGLALLGAWLDSGLVGMCLAFLLSNLFLWAYYLLNLSVRFFRPRLHVDPRLWWMLLRESAPVGVAMILRRLTWHVDVLILAQFGMTSAVGYFSAGYRLIQALDLVPLTVAQVVFPMMSRMARARDAHFTALVERSLRLMLVAALPLGVVLSLGAGRVVALIYGPAYAPAATSLAYMGLALACLFPSSVCAFVLTAMGAQRLYSVAALVCLAVNVVLDVLLVPRWAHVGAAVGTLASEVVLLTFCVTSLHRLGLRIAFPGLLARTAGAAAGMAVVLFILRDVALPWWLLGVLVGGGLYSALVWLSGAVSANDIAMIRSQLRARQGTAPLGTALE